MKAHKARSRAVGLGYARRRRMFGTERPLEPWAKMQAITAAQRRARRIARAALVARRLELGTAIDRLERLGVGTALSSPAQQRRTTIPAGPRATRLRALQRALERRIRVNPRKARTMAKKLKRNRLGRWVKAVRRRAGHAIAGTRARKRKKSRASRSRRALHPTQGVTMSRALVANPRRKRRRGAARRRTASGRFAKRATNPRKRRHARRNPRHHARRRRNPGMAGGFMKSAIGALLPMGVGGIGGAVCGLADAKFMSDKPTVSAISKIALGALGAALLRKRPALAYGWAGGVLGSLGYSLGVKAAGGLVAHSPTSALKGIADMAQENPEMAALLEGLGDVGPDNGVGDDIGDMGDGDEYQSALAGSDDSDGMGDLVEAD